IEAASVYPSIGSHRRQLRPGKWSPGFCLIGIVDNKSVVRASAAKNVTFRTHIFASARINEQRASIRIHGNVERVGVAVACIRRSLRTSIDDRLLLAILRGHQVETASRQCN